MQQFREYRSFTKYYFCHSKYIVKQAYLKNKWIYTILSGDMGKTSSELLNV